MTSPPHENGPAGNRTASRSYTTTTSRIPPTPDTDVEHAQEIRRIVRRLGCPAGCPLDHHECGVGEPLPGPQLAIDPAGGLHWLDPMPRPRSWRPRTGCCAVCGGELDPEALRARDDRCSACYAVLVGQRRCTLGRKGA